MTAISEKHCRTPIATTIKSSDYHTTSRVTLLISFLHGRVRLPGPARLPIAAQATAAIGIAQHCRGSGRGALCPQLSDARLSTPIGHGARTAVRACIRVSRVFRVSVIRCVVWRAREVSRSPGLRGRTAATNVGRDLGTRPGEGTNAREPDMEPDMEPD